MTVRPPVSHCDCFSLGEPTGTLPRPRNGTLWFGRILRRSAPPARRDPYQIGTRPRELVPESQYRRPILLLLRGCSERVRGPRSWARLGRGMLGRRLPSSRWKVGHPGLQRHKVAIRQWRIQTALSKERLSSDLDSGSTGDDSLCPKRWWIRPYTACVFLRWYVRVSSFVRDFDARLNSSNIRNILFHKLLNNLALLRRLVYPLAWPIAIHWTAINSTRKSGPNLWRRSRSGMRSPMSLWQRFAES